MYCATRYIPSAKLITKPIIPKTGISSSVGPLSAKSANDDPTINPAMIIAVVICLDISFIPSCFSFIVISPSSSLDKVLFTVLGRFFAKCSISRK